MHRRSVLKGIGAGLAMTALSSSSADAQNPETAVFELREYHTYEGKLDDLLRRFRDHTIAIFNRHHLRSIAYWTPMDEPLKGRTLFYILKHPNREAATANWASFHNDPEWKRVSAESEANGKLVEKVESTFLTLTDFSPRL